MKYLILRTFRYFHPGIIYCLLLTVCIQSGCQTLIFPTSSIHQLEIQDKYNSDSLKEKLNQDSWSSNKKWLDEWLGSETSTVKKYHEYRWRYAENDLDEQINLIDQIQNNIVKQTDPEDSPSNTKSKKDNVKPSKSPLLQLAQEDSLIGWNATIFLAFSNPEEASELTDRLKEIATSNLQYRSTDLMKIHNKKEKPKSETPPKKKRSIGERVKRSYHALVSDDDTPAKSSDQTKPSPDKKDSKDKDEEKKFKPKFLSKEMKLAALSAWCYVLSVQEESPIEGLANAGLLLESNNLQSDVRGELYRIAAQWIPVNDLPGFNKSFEDQYNLQLLDKKKRAEKVKKFTYLRLASLEACIISSLTKRNQDNPPAIVSYQKENWPVNISICSYDDLSKIRKAYGAWIVSVQHPDAIKVLTSQLNDQEITVRDSAIKNLGLLKTDAGKEELLRLANNNKDRIHLKAVEALVNYGFDAIAPFANDPAYSVRKAVAEGLSSQPSVESALLQYHFAVDKHPDVQKAAINAVHGWPDKYSIPVWSHGFTHSLRSTRRICARMLVESGKTNEPLSFDLSKEQRVAQIKNFTQNNGYPLTLIGLINERKKPNQNELDYHVQKEIIEDLNILINPAADRQNNHLALNRLKNLNANSVKFIEDYLYNQNAENSSIIYREVLPKLEPAYEYLLKMKEGKIQDRRKAARKLSLIGSKITLSKMVVKRLRTSLEGEQDKLIWTYSMNSVMNDRNEEISLLAQYAGMSAWSDIRILGCEYASKHPDPQFANWLLPMFYDQNRAVRLAAIQATGKTANPVVIHGYPSNSDHEAIPGLRFLLTDSDEEIRFNATISLCQLHDEQGYRELIRQTYHTSTVIREKVAIAMGQTKQALFLEHLIRLGWTESNYQVKRAVIASLKEIVPESQRDAELKEKKSIDEQIAIWAKWHQSSNNDQVMVQPVSSNP